MKDEYSLPIVASDLQQLLPHRYPMLMIDRVIEFVDSECIVGYKNISANEPCFAGHFPGRPIFPGVFILEAMAQLGALFAKLSTGHSARDKLLVFTGADEVRFRRQVIPGDTLRIEIREWRYRAGLWKIRAIAYVENDIAAEAIVLANEVD